MPLTMRGLSFFLFSLLLLFLLVTAFGLFFPSRVTVSRAVDIQASRTTVYELLADPMQWKQWFPGGDSLRLLKAEGQVTGIRTPNGNALLIQSQNDSTILVKGLQAAAVGGDMGFRLIGAQAQEGVTVQWFMNFTFDWYPWERFSSLLLENKFGSFMEQGLKNLQQQAQSAARIN